MKSHSFLLNLSSRTLLSETDLLLKTSVILLNVSVHTNRLNAASTICKATSQLKKWISQSSWRSRIETIIVLTNYLIISCAYKAKLKPSVENSCYQISTENSYFTTLSY